MKKKIIIECDLPKDYGLGNIYITDNLDQLTGDFFAITTEKKFVNKVLLESGFGFDEVDCIISTNFNIKQSFQTDMGIWESIFNVSVVDGYVTKIYEVATELRQKED